MKETKETLSSNSLFHFTNSAKNLIDILTYSFKPRYSLEDLGMFNISNQAIVSSFELGIPMVCFCDIPLSKIKYHLEFYGNYGIGLTKTWGVEKGVSPLLYVEQESETTKSLKSLYKIYNEGVLENESYKEIGNAIMRFLRYTKPYQGQFWREGKYLDGIRFYDEREWRYVPEIDGKEDLTPWISKKDYLDEIKVTRYNNILGEKYKLEFEPSDIKYIIVENEEQILSIIDAVEKIKSPFTDDIIKKLLSRILTKQQIIEDF